MMLRTFQVSKFLKEKKISKKSPDDFTREIVKLFLKSLISKREQLTSIHLEFAYFMSKNEVPLLGGNIYSSTLFKHTIECTLKSMMNARLRQHRFQDCHQNRLIKKIPTSVS